MFTGLIETVGQVAALRKGHGEWQLSVQSDLPMAEVKLGDSIAVSGACLTVTQMAGRQFTVEVSQESVAKTTFAALQVGAAVNLERALRMGGRLDGHLVQGHVDAVGWLESQQPRGGSMELWFRVPGEIGRYIIPKGSIAIDGISLTVNQVADGEDATRFSINVIPLTQRKTTLGGLAVGGRVNVETDLLGRYVERLLRRGGNCAVKGSDHGITEAFLKERGFA
ncbi:riboflavin synthase, alpha subunit [Magnetococcus marinus MC-1]|uniref:Riboflavin synthase n=1 Tax=Magnetococcus marinus (strain ATCC BAA-1437 / JCM 17883 / MC-1) TaxID=156889 RepID=A0L401_MAGMM|nr:riboflavin synthase [Magnetococcus marinus]ABK42694.1 riboflavin synthase, alpha subunit [Magnetococcus marinus MC-1]